MKYILYILLSFKLYSCTPPQLFQSYFLPMDISIRQDVFFTS